MDYHELAEELLDLHSKTPHIQGERQTSRLIHGEIGVLNYLSVHNNHAYPKDLSNALSVSTARIASILNQLERRRLVTRTRDPLDNRQVIVQLTEQGQQLIALQRSHMLEEMKQCLEFLGPEDAQNFVRILKRLVQFVPIHQRTHHYSHSAGFPRDRRGW